MTAAIYTPLAGTVAAKAVRHLQKLPEGESISSAELAEAIGQPASCIVPCMEPARRNGLVVATQADTGGPKASLRWRMATDDEQRRALDAVADATKAAKLERRQDRAEDREHALPRAKPVGVATLNWKPPKPSLPEPEPEPEPGPRPAVVAPPERHLAARAWFGSTGELVIEAGEHEFVFPRLEARQLVRTIRELGEAWA